MAEDEADLALPTRLVQWKVYAHAERGFVDLPGDVSEAVERLFRDGGAQRGRVYSAQDLAHFDVDIEGMRILSADAGEATGSLRLRGAEASAPVSASAAALLRLRAAQGRGAGATTSLRAFFGPPSPASDLERAEELRAAEQARRRAEIRSMIVRARTQRRLGGGGPAQPIAPQEPWDCEACTLINAAGDLYCAVCGTPNSDAMDAAHAHSEPSLPTASEEHPTEDVEEPYESDMVTFLQALRMGDRIGDRISDAQTGRASDRVASLIGGLVEGNVDPAGAEVVPITAVISPPPPPPVRPPPQPETPRRGSIMAIFQSARALLRAEPMPAGTPTRPMPSAAGATPASRMRARLRSRSSSEGSTASEGTSPTPTLGTSPAETGLRFRHAAQRRSDPPRTLAMPAGEPVTPPVSNTTPLRVQLPRAPPAPPTRAASLDAVNPSVLRRLDARGGRLLRSVTLPAEEPAWEHWEWLADTGWERFDANASETICATVEAGRDTMTLHVQIPFGNPRILSRSLTRGFARPHTLVLDLQNMVLTPGANGRFSGRPLRKAPGGRALAEKRASLGAAMAQAFFDAADVTEKIMAADPYAECSICLGEFEDTPVKGGCVSDCCCEKMPDLRATQLRHCRGHAFHKSCLEEWWQRMDVEKDDLACPTCTQVYAPCEAGPSAEN